MSAPQNAILPDPRSSALFLVLRVIEAKAATQVGFIDGAENPQGAERAAVALIGADDPAFAGGSYAFKQKYLHDFDRWTQLATAAQERVIGRRKADSEDLPAADKPATAHNQPRDYRGTRHGAQDRPAQLSLWYDQ